MGKILTEISEGELLDKITILEIKLKEIHVTKGINILEDETLRQGIKDFSDWPTIPQLYVKGEFIGGCDIVKEMFENQELKKLFEKKGII